MSILTTHLLTQVINLESSTERMSKISNQLETAGLKFERFPAVDMRQCTPCDIYDYDDARARHVLGRPMSGGEIGCYLSHIGCAERFLESDATFGLVLEDDANVAEESTVQLADYLDILKDESDWAIVNLGRAPRRFYMHVGGDNNTGLFRAFYYPVTTTALVWSRKGAEQFVSEHRRMSEPVDIEIRKMVGASGRGLAAKPALFPASEGKSTIDGSVQTRREKKRAVRYRLRTITRRIKENTNAVAGWIASERTSR